MSYREFLNKLLLGNEGSSGGASSWDEISGKPSAFPPSAHTHAQADVTGLTDIAAKAHTHANKTTLDKLAEADGKLTYDGAEIGGGGTVDESRLLPALDSVPVDRSGNPVVFRAVSEGMDEHTVLYCPFDVDFNDHSAAGGQFIQTGRKSESIVTTEKKFGAGSLNCGDNYNTYLNGPLAKPIGASDCTIHFWVKYNNFRHGGSFSLLTGSVSDNSTESEFYAASVGCLTLIVNADAIELMLRTNSGGSATDIINVTNTINTGEWSHIAITHSGDTWHLFLNGTLLGTGVNTAVTNATHIRIGGGNAYTMNGNLDEFIILDYARWITDFEPPTQPATTLIRSYEVSDKAPIAVESPADGELLIGQGGKFVKITLAELKAKLDMLATGGNTGN